MTQIIYTDRSRTITYQRCRRMRWLEYHEGEDGKGLVPAKKSLHLVVGGAVHQGMEVLLRDGQAALDMLAGDDLAAKLDNLFVELRGGTQTVARGIEDRAVAAALAHLTAEMGEAGVELDAEEAAAQARQQVDMSGLAGSTISEVVSQDSPIVIDFSDLAPPTDNSFVVSTPESVEPGFFAKEYAAQPPRQSDSDYLREELAALTEGMVRAWARRRWRPLLEQFEVLEVEREGEWKVAEWSDGNESWNGAANDWNNDATSYELHFLSRHDALLRERATDYLYLQSYKTTGSWDRRKELDAQVDVQGLSEAVDVERRLGEAWELLQKTSMDDFDADSTRLRVLLDNERIQHWLSTLPAPPTILGVRYEYLLKGSRKQDKKAGSVTEGRWVQDSILCRAYKQEGITADDRRWAWTWEWYENDGRGGRKSRKLPWQSWQKAPVWHYMSMAEWIDRLDRFEIQEGAEGEMGEPLDALAQQFVPVLIAYRNQDDARDWLEQLEAQEVGVARAVEEVRQAEREGGYGAKRSALNRLFPQNRQACSYPGVCQFRATSSQAGFCFGGPDPLHDAMVMERFRSRVPNHPAEGLVQITTEVENAH